MAGDADTFGRRDISEFDVSYSVVGTDQDPFTLEWTPDDQTPGIAVQGQRSCISYLFE